MTPLDIAAYTVLEDLVTYVLHGSFFAAAHVSGQLGGDVPHTNFWEGVL